jgi:aconitate hydratase
VCSSDLGCIRINLAQVEPMIALPFHPSNAWSIREFLSNADDLLAGVEKEAADILGKGAAAPNLRAKFKNGIFTVDQGIVAGCSGSTYESMYRVGTILQGKSVGSGAFGLSVYPASLPQFQEMVRTGLANTLIEAGVTIKTAFCGPCFGAGDVPANNAFSIRHTTRNFPNREGSKPSEGQMSYVALMDARSIAATAANQGRLTAATDLEQSDGLVGLLRKDVPANPCHEIGVGGPSPAVKRQSQREEALTVPPKEIPVPYTFNPRSYETRVYRGFGKADPDSELILGPNITDWPAMPSLPENLLLTVVSAIYDPVTTTDEIIPSGETSSYRSNPLRLAEFTLSRKDPEYVGRARAALSLEEARRGLIGQRAGEPCAAAPYTATAQEVKTLFAELGLAGQEAHTGLGSLVFALKPGDGSAREQAASSQKVLGGWANIASEYATKRYRANLVNWGMLPFILDNAASVGIGSGDRFFLPGIRQVLAAGLEEAPATLFQNGERKQIVLRLPGLTKNERDIILAGCLINYYAGR